MAFLKVKNRAIGSLASGVSDTATTWTVASGGGANFPASGDFHLTCEDEIVKCTARSGDVLTVVRAQEGTSATSHAAGKSVELRITAGFIESRTTWTADKLLKGAGAGSDPTEIDIPSYVIWKDSPTTCLALSDQDAAIDWTDLDLTAHTSASAKFAILALHFVVGTSGSSGDSYLRLRKNGTTATAPYWGTSCVEEDWAMKDNVLILGVDSGQVIEYKLELATGAANVYITITVVGYVE